MERGKRRCRTLFARALGTVWVSVKYNRNLKEDPREVAHREASSSPQLLLTSGENAKPVSYTRNPISREDLVNN